MTNTNLARLFMSDLAQHCLNAANRQYAASMARGARDARREAMADLAYITKQVEKKAAMRHVRKDEDK